MHTTLNRTILVIIILAALCGSVQAGTGIWSTTGPLTSGTGDRFIYALAVSPDGSVVYCGTGGGRVFSYTFLPTATHFVITPTTPATAGSPVTYTVMALDSSNNPVTGYAGTVQIASSDSAATLPSDITMSGSTATFSVTLKTAGSRTITATDTATSPITGTATITVNPSTVHGFSFSATPASTPAGSSFSTTITAIDQYGNTATGYAGTVHFSSSDGAADLPSDSTLTNGVGSFSVTLKTAGSRTITARDTITASITGSSAITVTPAAGTRFSVSAPASALAGSSSSITVTALDSYGNTGTGYTGTVHLTSSDSTAIIPADSTLTLGEGSFSITLKTAGAQTITATDTGTASITGASSVTVTPGAATRLALVAPASATAGSPISFTVTALDQYGNTATGYAGTVHFTSSDSTATLPSDTLLSSGTGTFSTILRTAGSRTITGTDTGSSSVTGITGTIAVSVTTTTTTTSPTTTTTSGAGSPPSGGDSDSSAPSSSNGRSETVSVTVGGNSAVNFATVTGTGVSGLIVTGTVAPGPGTAPPGTAYQYISLVPARYTTITGALITFTVPAAWLAEQDLAPEDVVMQHYSGGTWSALPTTPGTTANGFVTFTAASPGFSLFAITGTPGTASAQEQSRTIGKLAESNVAGQSAAQVTAKLAPVMSQPTTTAVPAPALPGTGFPPATIALIGAGCVVLIGSGWWVRRWWRRRQNPTLFAEY